MGDIDYRGLFEASVDYRPLLEGLSGDPGPGPQDDEGTVQERADAQRLMAFEAAQRSRAGLPAQEPTETDYAGEKALGRAIAGTGISIVGSAGGAALGTAIGGPVGGVLGEMGGSYGARKLNVALGLEEPGLGGDIASVAVPGAVRGYQALKNPALRHLPGAGAALHQEGAERLAALPGTMQPARPSADLYAEVATHNPMIRPSNIWQSASEVIRREGRLQPTMRNARVARVAEDMHQLVRDHGGQVPLQVLQEHHQRLGLMVRQASTENWPEARALRQMYGAFYQDLEYAASRGVPGADLLRQANRAARQEFALEDLTTMFAPGHPGILTRPDGLVQLHGGKLRDTFEKRLASDELFRGSFAPDQLHAIRGFFREIERLPRIPAQRGVAVGSSLAVGRFAGGAGAAHALGLGPEAAVIAGYVTNKAPQVISQALMSEPGRAWLLRTLATEGGISPATLGLVSGGGRQIEQGMTVEHTPAPSP